MDDLRQSYLTSRKRLTDPEAPEPDIKEIRKYLRRKSFISGSRSNIDYAMGFINSHIRVKKRRET
jgi:hypothetical protein